MHREVRNVSSRLSACYLGLRIDACPVVARNFAFVAVGMYLWEGVQCSLYDLRVLAALVNQCGLSCLRVFCSIDNTRESTSSRENSDSKPPSSHTSQGHSQCRFSGLDSQQSDLSFPFLNAVAQLAYILLRISTFLTLLSILMVLNEALPIPGNSCLGWNESNGTRCRIELSLVLGCSV